VGETFAATSVSIVTMEWQPQDEPLRQLAGYLRDSLNAYDRAVQKQAEQVSLQPVAACFSRPLLKRCGLCS